MCPRSEQNRPDPSRFQTLPKALPPTYLAWRISSSRTSVPARRRPAWPPPPWLTGAGAAAAAGSPSPLLLVCWRPLTLIEVCGPSDERSTIATRAPPNAQITPHSPHAAVEPAHPSKRIPWLDCGPEIWMRKNWAARGRQRTRAWPPSCVLPWVTHVFARRGLLAPASRKRGCAQTFFGGTRTLAGRLCQIETQCSGSNDRLAPTTWLERASIEQGTLVAAAGRAVPPDRKSTTTSSSRVINICAPLI